MNRKRETEMQTLGNRDALKSLWWAWVITTGLITVAAIISFLAPRLWTPIICFASAAGLNFMVRHNNISIHTPRCYIIPFIGISIMLGTGIITATLEIWYTPSLFGSNPAAHTPSPDSLPYMGTLVVYPLALLFFGYATLRKSRFSYCVDCCMRYGSPAERGFIGRLFNQEGMYQRKLATIISAVVTFITYAYYFLIYNNNYISTRDQKIFVILPVVVFVATALLLALRYFVIWFYYSQDLEGSALRHGSSTTVRYLIIAGNEIFLHIPDPEKDIMVHEVKPDTPAHTTISLRRSVDLSYARELFSYLVSPENSDENAALEGYDIRFMFESDEASGMKNVFHYLVFASSKELVDNSNLNGSWHTIHDIKDMIDNNDINFMLASEIHRLYTFSMAARTYHKNGRRKYPVKHYRPTFRLSDAHKWDIDYNDPIWYFVSSNNQDSRFYHLRSLWRKYMSGLNK